MKAHCSNFVLSHRVQQRLLSNGYLSSQSNELKFTQPTKLQHTALWFSLSVFPEAALNKQTGKILPQMLSQVIFRGAASQYLALPVCPSACLSVCLPVLQLAYKDDIHCASLRPYRTVFLINSKGGFALTTSLLNGGVWGIQFRLRHFINFQDY